MPRKKLKIVLAGIIARYPFGGVTWCSLMYLLGLRALGHDVFYLEDTGECGYDPETNAISLDSSYGINCINTSLSQFGLGDQWAFVDYKQKYSGKTQEQIAKVCADADLFINLSGGAWFWRDEYLSIPSKIFIDTDPAFTQRAIHKGVAWLLEFFEQFTTLFTFGNNIGSEDCAIEQTPYEWKKTWQPIFCSEWRTEDPPARDSLTTIMTWKTQSFEDADGNKDKQFKDFLSLPSLTDQKIELAVNGGEDILTRSGWSIVPGMEVSRDINRYRDYIRESKGEFSIAKHLYVKTRSGWFSDRSQCYLASGRPVLVQKTGFEKYLPTGSGIIGFSNLEEALLGIDLMNSAYSHHSKAAVEIAREYFDSDRVLTRLLQDCGLE